MTDIEQTLRALVRDEVARALAEREQRAELVTVADYAKQWSLSQSTVREAIREGRLAVERVGRAVRVPADAKIDRRVDRDDPTARARLRLLRGGGR